MQIVLSGNRVIAHGEDCFLSMGGTVICEETGKAYPNATIAEVDAIPADVDSVGYEYHAGVFVPCAPYGKTNKGSVMLACDECGAPRSSDITSENGGLHIPGELTGAKMPADVLARLGMNSGDLADALVAIKNGGVKCATGQYTGAGTYGSANKNTLNFGFKPLLVFVAHKAVRGTADDSTVNYYNVRWAQMLAVAGQTQAFVQTSWEYNDGNYNMYTATVSWTDTGISWYSTEKGQQLNQDGTTYVYFAIG